MRDTKLALLIAGVLILLAAMTRESPSASESGEMARVVPLEYAQARGADRWSASTLEQFLDDPENQIRLRDVDLALRAGRGPDEWLPATGQCDYMGRFMAVMERYRLHHTEPDWQDWLTRRQRCYTQFQ